MVQVQPTEEERATLWQEVWKCRKALAVEHKMLQEPPEKANFLTTTLRRWANNFRDYYFWRNCYCSFFSVATAYAKAFKIKN